MSKNDQKNGQQAQPQAAQEQETIEQQVGDSDVQTETFASLEDLQARINDDAAFARQYVENPEKYHSMIVPDAEQQQGGEGDPQGQQSPQGDPNNQQGSEDAPDQTETIVFRTEDGSEIRIPKTEFGTYLTNRSPGEALMEALKGNREKDRTIEFLTSTERELRGSTVSLRRQLQEAEERRKQTPARKGKASQPASGDEAVSIEDDVPIVDMSVLDTIEDPSDMLDSDKGAAVLNTLKSLAQANQKLRDRINSESTSLRSAIENVQKQGVDRSREDTAESIRKQQLQDLERFVMTTPGLVPSQGSFVALDQQVADFQARINRLAGSNQGYDLYFSDSDEGKQLREKAQNSGVYLPPDFDKHQEIMGVREEMERRRGQIREQMKASLGRDVEDWEVPPPISYNELYRLTAPSTPPTPAPQPSTPASQAVGRHQQSVAAQQQRQTVPEPPPATHTGMPGSGRLSEQEMFALLQRHTSTYSPVEARMVLDFYQENNMPIPALLQQKAASAV